MLRILGIKIMFKLGFMLNKLKPHISFCTGAVLRLFFTDDDSVSVALLWFKEHKSYEQGFFVSKCRSKQNSNLFS